MNFHSIQNALMPGFFLKDKITYSLTSQQKKIAIIAFGIFSACLTSIFIYNHFQAKKLKLQEIDSTYENDIEEDLSPFHSPDNPSQTFVMRNLVAHVNKGKFESIDSQKEEYIIENGPAYEIVKKSPEYTGNPHFTAISFKLSSQSDQQLALNDKVMQIYNEAIKDERHCPGPFGDIIKIIQLDPYTYAITEIAERSFPKPAMASDLVTIFKTKEGYMFVGIIRDREPGVDKPAIVGGFTGIEALDRKQPASIHNRKVLDAPLYTALKKGKEEGNLRIEVRNIKDYREDYNVKEVEGKFINKKDKKEFNARIINLGCFKTGDDLIKNGGELLGNGSKRVYITHGFLCYADMSDMTMDEIIKTFNLNADDDAKALFIAPLNSEDEIENIEFGIQHHSTILKAAFETLQTLDESNDITASTGNKLKGHKDPSFFSKNSKVQTVMPSSMPLHKSKTRLKEKKEDANAGSGHSHSTSLSSKSKVLVPRISVKMFEEFYQNQGKDVKGRKLFDLQNMSFSRKESTHNYIQWLFPTNQKSKFNSDAPAFNLQQFTALSQNAIIKENVKLSFIKMLEFYGLQYDQATLIVQKDSDFEEKARNWLTSNNHNLLRISRILRSLNLFGLHQEAQAFYQFLNTLRAHPALTKRNFDFWEKAISSFQSP